MKIECIHGYFIFEETAAGQLSDFMSRYGLDIERSGNHFTFSDLVDAPDYSIVGGLYLGAPAKVTYSGPPWEIMRENELVYDFTKGLVLPITSITQTVSISAAGGYFITNGMLLPGSISDDGSRVMDYSASYIKERNVFRYSEISYE